MEVDVDNAKLNERLLIFQACGRKKKMVLRGSLEPYNRDQVQQSSDECKHFWALQVVYEEEMRLLQSKKE